MNRNFIHEATPLDAKLPRLGLGCAAIGNLYAAVSDAEARDTLAAAVAGGIGYFDTSPYYGHGLSETRLGAFLAAAPPGLLVSSKVGRGLAAGEAAGDTGFVDAALSRPYFDYSHDGVRAQIGDSLTRLQRERLDIALVHDIGALTHGADHPRRLREALDGAFPALAALKAQGVVGAIGIGVNEVAVCLETLAATDIDIILLAGRYTLLEQTALDDLLPLCLTRRVRVVIGGPYNSGVLAGGDHYDYGAVPVAVRSRVAALAAVCARFGVPLAAAALQFPLAHPAVASVIPGARSVAEITATLAWLAWPIPAALWTALRREGLLHPGAPVPAG